MRTIVDLPEEQLQQLDQICKIEGISRAEAVRRAVKGYTRDYQYPESDKAFGLWRDRDIDGRNFEDALRDEWHEPR